MLLFCLPALAVSVQPTISSVAATEGGGGKKRSDGSNGEDGGGVGGRGMGGASGSGDSQVMVCIELATGNLQRNLTLIATTIDSPTATGNLHVLYK